ncbi:MAG: alpha/beta hydrolase [Gordonia sp. (in: high G+C Gram-positive bacteria)]|uniref:alpha/beta fold hydrolase n=1 Tax=Gordonia sp. (in: high G+C Gram-positive bacteria) TaxID=84139 RepID=UPI0039E65763
MPTLAIDDVQLHYNDAGNGDPIVLISGLGSSSSAWTAVEPLLSDRRVITVDNRGTGRTVVGDYSWTVDDMADDVVALIEHLGIGPCDIVGWSMGGSILQSILIRHPGVARKAILLATFARYSPTHHLWLDSILAAATTDAAPEALAISGMPWLFTARTLADHHRLAELARMSASDPYPTPPEGFAAQAACLRIYDTREGLPTVTDPVLVLVGGEDVLTPPAQSIEVAELIPTAHLQILPRGGHAITAEYPEDLVAAIKGYLND